MIEAGLIEQRPRTATGKSFSLHPSDELLDALDAASRTACDGSAPTRFGGQRRAPARDYYFGGSYMAGADRSRRRRSCPSR